MSPKVYYLAVALDTFAKKHNVKETKVMFADLLKDNFTVFDDERSEFCEAGCVIINRRAIELGEKFESPIPLAMPQENNND